jgi:hypothetical protein
VPMQELRRSRQAYPTRIRTIAQTSITTHPASTLVRALIKHSYRFGPAKPNNSIQSSQYNIATVMAIKAVILNSNKIKLLQHDENGLLLLLYSCRIYYHFYRCRVYAAELQYQ